MLRLRRFERKCAELSAAGRIRGVIGNYSGEEALAVGVMQALTRDDAVVVTYREHGHALTRGVPADRLMSDLFGKRAGCSRGRSGSMHVFEAQRRVYGGHAQVGGGLPLAVGLALADALQQRRHVTACIFEARSVPESELYQSVKLSALWNLPVLFVCENNLAAARSRGERTPTQSGPPRSLGGIFVPAEPIDGMDVEIVEAAARDAAHRARLREGPAFLECRTYRASGRPFVEAGRPRVKEDETDWRARDPIVTFTERLKQRGDAADALIAALDASVVDEIEVAAIVASAATPEPVTELLDDVYSPDSPDRRTDTHVDQAEAKRQKPDAAGKSSVPNV